MKFLCCYNFSNNCFQNCYHHLYADDTVIIHSHQNVDTLISEVETELLNIDRWLNLNKLTINTGKTETIFFGSHRRLKKVDDKIINYKGIPLKRSIKVKYLGVLFDHKMQWEDHIKTICGKISMKLSRIKAVSPCLTPDTKKLLVNALVKL